MLCYTGTAQGPWLFEGFGSYLNRTVCLSCFSFCQRVGDRGSAGWRPVSAENLPADAGAEAGPLHAGPAEAAGGADEDYGQCGHLLHAAHALHLHLQVGRGRGGDLTFCLTL